MPNIIDIGEGFLNDQLMKHASELVEYRVKNHSYKSVMALIGMTFFSSSDVNGLSVKSRGTDFIVNAEELGHTPERGDVIIRRGRLYEVNAPSGEDCWRFSGDSNSLYRIHTVCIGDDSYIPLDV